MRPGASVDQICVWRLEESNLYYRMVMRDTMDGIEEQAEKFYQEACFKALEVLKLIGMIK